MTKNWSFAKITDILLKNLGQWLYLKITISTKLWMSIPLSNNMESKKNIFYLSWETEIPKT